MNNYLINCIILFKFKFDIFVLFHNYGTASLFGWFVFPQFQ